MPMLVRENSLTEGLRDHIVAMPEAVGRNCRLSAYQKRTNIRALRVPGEFIAYASPDSTYAVARRLLDGAQRSILIGIYDFSAGYMKDILLQALARGVKVSLMLDLDGIDGEQRIFDELGELGAETVAAPSCASEHVSYFPSSHEKVIVIDDKWVLVQSGNYSKNSIPFNEKDGGDPQNFVTGNRDMGIAIKSKPLATFFKDILRSDMKLELDAEGVEALARRRLTNDTRVTLVERAPSALPIQLFRSKSFNPANPVKVTPILSPDNYLDVIPGFLAGATKSILIEQQYIRASQDKVAQLLAAIRQAKNNTPNLDVRIILGKIFGQSDIPKEKANLKILREEYGLKLGTNVRYIDTTRFVHCHNKTIIVDGKIVLVSSQNWSNTGVGTNREAGVLMEYPEIARYYANIFESDWQTAKQTLPQPGAETIGAESLRRGGLIDVSYGDYADV